MFNHPLGSKNRFAVLGRYLQWQLSSRLIGAAIAMPFIGSSRLLVKSGMHGATMNLYVGIQEFEDVGFLLHFLRHGDTFVDIGANIGVFSVLAAKLRKATVIALEPVPATYDEFVDDIHLNRIDELVTARNIGVAAEEGEFRFSETMGPRNHVILAEDGNPFITVPVVSLDELASDCSPALIKIDVEGFENAVIRGGRHVLSSPALLALIVELNGSGKRYGFDDSETGKLIREHGFVSYQYAPFERRLIESCEPNTAGNVLFIRPDSGVEERLQAADFVEIHGFKF